MGKSKEHSDSIVPVMPVLFDTWMRAKSCRIQGESVVADGHVVWYSPTSITDLTGEFAAIVDAAAAVRFVAEYGPLTLPEGVFTAGSILGATTVEWAEPVGSLLVRAKKVARIRRAGALFNDTRSEVQENLASSLVDLFGLKVPFSAPKSAAKHLSAADAEHVVGKFILQELNEHLPQSCERAHVNVRGQFQPILSFQSLLALVYRRLFEELERGRLRLCQECDTVFEWADPRQMYCSKRCGLNLAQRRYRERQAD